MPVISVSEVEARRMCPLLSANWSSEPIEKREVTVGVIKQVE